MAGNLSLGLRISGGKRNEARKSRHRSYVPPASGERHPEPRRESQPRPAAEQKPRQPAPAPLGPGPHEGQVKWYDREKGYGFIVHPGGEELFFHRTGLALGEIPDFPDGTREETEKGPQAADVERMDA